MGWLKLITGLAGLVLVVAAGTNPLGLPALAQSASKSAAITKKAAQAALHTGYKSLTANNTKQAIADLSRAIGSGKLSSNEMAKALYYRGQAYQTAQRPAEAIADLTSALWMKGALSERDRKAAMALRQKTYQQAGVSGPALGFSTTGETTTITTAAPRQPRPATPPARSTATARATTTNQGWAASTAPAKTQSTTTSSSNGVANFFSNLFGGSSSSTSTGSVSTQPTSTSTSSSTSSTAWKSQTSPSAAQRTQVARAPARPSRSANTGRYYIQVASMRDPGQAKSVARTVEARHRTLLNGRKPTVETGVLGNMGTFHLVRIRAFRSKPEASKLCGKLLASGLDCLVKGG